MATAEVPVPRILVVDDEPNIADLLSVALRFEGYDVVAAGTGTDALDLARTYRPHLVMLDVMLPDLDGNEVGRRLRLQGDQVPIVFLTARDTVQDKVEGLALGDDYVTKPFSIEELMARVAAILRRAGEVEAADASILRFADLTMHIDTHEVWRQEHPIDLTATEFNLLRHLLENARRVISKSELIDNVWGYGFSGRPEHRRDLHQLPAQEDRRGRACAHPHHPTSGVHPPAAQRRVTLQRRLVAVMSILLVVGLLVADVVTYVSVRSFLYGRADDTLASSEALAFNYVAFATEHKDAAVGRRPVAPRLARRVRAHHQPRRARWSCSRPSGSPDQAQSACHSSPPRSRCSELPTSPTATSAAMPGPSAPIPNAVIVGSKRDPGRALPGGGGGRAPGHHVRGALAQPHQRHAGLAAPGRDAGQHRRPRRSWWGWRCG